MAGGGAGDYTDPIGSLPERPKTSATRAPQTNMFDNDDFGDDMLPE
jgi:hypothetical protein